MNSNFTQQFDEQGRMPILEGMRYYKKTNEENNMFRFLIRLKDIVDESCLQYAAEKALSRYRIFRLTVMQDEKRFYLKENMQKPVIHKDDHKRHRVCTPKNNDHLFYISYNNYEITFDVFHGITDGRGVLSFLHTLLYYYCEQKYGLDNPQNPGRIMAETPEDPKEYINSMLFLQKDTAAPGKRYVWEDAFSIPEKQMDSHIESKYYEMRVNAQELNNYVQYHHTSRASLFALFMNRVIADTHDTAGKPIVSALAIDARKIYDAPETMQCCVGTIPLWYNNEIAALPLAKQLALTKQMLKQEMNPNNLLSSALGLKKFNQMLEERFPTLEEKKAFCRQRAQQGNTRYTYGLSYVGEISFGEGIDEHVEDCSFLLCANTLPIIIEIIKYKENYLISYCTHLENDIYIDKLQKLFLQEGISCTYTQKDNFIETMADF